VLEKLQTLEQVYALIQDDPVRPHIAADWRMRSGREVYALKDNDEITAVICVAYMDEVPTCEQDMKWPGIDVAVFYTVWSYKKGAGRKIVLDTAQHIKKVHTNIKRFVTLSPLTEMAERFHLRNGATLLAKHKYAQNFEYKI
tara:strand:- start:2958 stop:3383 length:426 start_codon:yes stop_codon:yes gene_type:complete